MWQNLCMHEAGDVTGLLDRWAGGSADALDLLLPLVMEELKGLARHHMSQVGDTVVFQPTSLVNEAYLKLVDADVRGFESRRRFFAFASQIMKDLLRDYARHRGAVKRGGGVVQTSLEDALEIGSSVDLETMLMVDQVLERLAATHPRQAKVVELRLWGGLTVDEIAEFLGRSRPTVERDWALGRRRLVRDLRRSDGESRSRSLG